jgi:hypothetical protein
MAKTTLTLDFTLEELELIVELIQDVKVFVSTDSEEELLSDFAEELFLAIEDAYAA